MSQGFSTIYHMKSEKFSVKTRGKQYAHTGNKIWHPDIKLEVLKMVS